MAANRNNVLRTGNSNAKEQWVQMVQRLMSGRNSFSEIIKDFPNKEQLWETAYEYAVRHKDDAICQFIIGESYLSGYAGVEINERTAFSWYKRSADQGLMVSQYLLGYCYETGTGVETNIDKAIEWYELAAYQGHINALHNIGHSYEIKGNFEKAIQYYKRSIKNGSQYGFIKSAMPLANLYLNRRRMGLPVDMEAVCECYRRAESRDPDARYLLGECYETGNGAPQDIKRAWELYETAAIRDSVMALRKLYFHYIKLKNETRARQILRRIGELGANLIPDVLLDEQFDF